MNLRAVKLSKFAIKQLGSEEKTSEVPKSGGDLTTNKSVAAAGDATRGVQSSSSETAATTTTTSGTTGTYDSTKSPDSDKSTVEVLKVQ